MGWARALVVAIALAGCEARPPLPATFEIHLDPAPLPMPIGHHLPVEPPSRQAPDRPAGGGSSGGGASGGGAPAAGPALPPDLSLRVVTGIYGLSAVAGAPAGGNDLGADPLSARFQRIGGVAVTADGTVYMADPLNHQIRAVTPAGECLIVAGAGDGTSGYTGENLPAVASRLAGPTGLAYDPRTGALVVADRDNGRLRHFVPGGRLYTMAGGGTSAADTVAQATAARLAKPVGVAIAETGVVVFTEGESGKVRRVAPDGGLSTIATLPGGRGGAIAARATDGLVWAADGGRVFRLLPGAIQAIQAQPVLTLPEARVTGLAYDQAGSLFVSYTDADAGGRACTRVARLAVGADGHAKPGAEPLVIAGSGGEAADDQAYALAPASDAVTQLLPGAGECSLFVDVAHAADPDRLSGLVYGGASYERADGSIRWGQVFRLTPQ